MDNNASFSKYKLLAIDIYEWCVKHDLWGDNIIYFDGKAWSNMATWGGVKGKQVADGLYEYEDKNPREYFGGGSALCSMSFEGPLNYVLNGYVGGWAKKYEQFHALFEKYGLVFEMYNAWNGNAYEI